MSNHLGMDQILDKGTGCHQRLKEGRHAFSTGFQDDRPELFFVSDARGEFLPDQALRFVEAKRLKPQIACSDLEFVDKIEVKLVPGHGLPQPTEFLCFLS